MVDDQFISGIKGFIDPDEGQRLYELALEAARLGPCLEVGSYCGKSAVYLATACRQRGQILFSIDHHRGSEEQQPGQPYFDPELFDPRQFKIDTFAFFRRTIEQAGLEQTVVPLVCSSLLAARSWTTALGLIFIDGSHDQASVESDFNQWSPHLITGGYLLFHDVFPNPADGGQGPYMAYRQAIASSLYEVLPMTGSLAVLRKSQ